MSIVAATAVCVHNHGFLSLICLPSFLTILRKYFEDQENIAIISDQMIVSVTGLPPSGKKEIYTYQKYFS